MDQTPEEIAKEIEETREALGDKVDAFSGQLRESVDVAKSKGLKVVGMIAAAVVGILTLKKIRNR
ncbi:MAG TPA: DUF3618 domain-containing protein [Actinomycetota bacterium]|nr:DUF3618 domain-containing protein [Actinomycetota bacterium]